MVLLFNYEIMKSLNTLTNVEKAKLLHGLLIAEIPQFITYLKAQAENILSRQEEIAAGWNNQLFGPDFWFELAVDSQRKVSRYEKELKRSANSFAEQLFDGYSAIFTVHMLTQYVAGKHYQDPKFERAIDFLFS